jgi:hypothetical protein
VLNITSSSARLLLLRLLLLVITIYGNRRILQASVQDDGSSRAVAGCQRVSLLTIHGSPAALLSACACT